jgi:type VI secretion system protein VasD
MTTRELRQWKFASQATRLIALGILVVVTSQVAPAADRGSSQSASPSFSIEATLVGGPNLNPNLQGRASPVVVRVFELKQTAAFRTANFSSLFERSKEALGDGLVAQREFILRPGDIRHYDRAGDPQPAALGLAAAFRTLDKDTWRVIVPIAPGTHNLLLIDFDNNEIRVPSISGESGGR